MSKKDDKESPIRAWLSTGEAQALIRQAALSVLRVANERRYSFAFIGMDPTPVTNKGFLLEDIESALKVFILENRRGIQTNLLVFGPKAGRVLQVSFLREWIDATRNRERDRWRYLYKRTVDAMRASPEFRRKKGPEGAILYSLADKSITLPETYTEHIPSIHLSETLLFSESFEGLGKANVLLGLAGHFWNALSDKFGGEPIWIPVRVLINWIATYVPLDKEQTAEGGQGTKEPLDTMPDDSLGPEVLYFDRDQVVRWAEKVANSMEKDECAAFSLHHGDGLTLAEVAGKLGYRGPSGPSYLIDRAKDRLRRFLRDLPWISPPDMNEEAWALFIEALLSALKKRELKP